MNHASNISTLPGKRPPDMGIAWEPQPSLQHRVVRTDEVQYDAPAWAATMPATFEAITEPDPFDEPLEGLSMREVNEPEIFRVFFGEADRAVARA